MLYSLLFVFFSEFSSEPLRFFDFILSFLLDISVFDALFLSRNISDESVMLLVLFEFEFVSLLSIEYFFEAILFFVWSLFLLLL